MKDPIEAASAFAAERFPEALAVILAGSAAAGRATSTSDLDIVVVQAVGAETFRDTLRFDGWLVELFAHTPDTQPQFWARDIECRRGTMVFMCATGILIADRYGCGGQIQARAKALLDAGPGRLSPDELDVARYMLSAALDDLADANDIAECAVCAEVVLCGTADLVCAMANRWTGRGKWLPRRLLAADPDLGRRLLDSYLGAATDPTSLIAVADEVLARVGGRLQEGFRQTWPGEAKASQGRR